MDYKSENSACGEVSQCCLNNVSLHMAGSSALPPGQKQQGLFPVKFPFIPEINHLTK